MTANRVGVVGTVACLAAVLLGCTATTDGARRPPADPDTSAAAEVVAPPRPTSTADTVVIEQDPLSSPPPSSSAPPSSAPSPDRSRPGAEESRQPRRALLSIPAIDVHALRVIAYRGAPDDRRGTEIQNGGVAASPRGPGGGVGPGMVGNYIVTAHRLSAGGPFGDLPALREGEHVLVTAAGRVYDYEVRRTMTISFRSERSKARQTAAVPGHPGRAATRPMITLSTCATPEDHARGNYWSDQFGNPEHRIDKVGVLVDVRPA